ncbi:MAG: hypothetical protein ACYS99_16875 [Planctomycetota bacterium]|jgi:hypothetical protein
MRIALITTLLALLLLAVAIAATVTEEEPNDDPTDPGYKGDLGTLGNETLIVTGAIASYGAQGDQDFYGILVPSDTLVSLSLHGFAGKPFLAVLDEDLKPIPGIIPVSGEGTFWIPMFTLPAPISARTYFIGSLAGESGPDNDPYTLSIIPGADGVLRVMKAKVKLPEKKPDKPARQSAKIVAEFDGPGIDPTVNGLLLELLGQQYLFAPGALTQKKSKFIHKGSKGELLRKFVIDNKKGRVTVVLKKGDIGAPGLLNQIDLHIEAGGLRLEQTITEGLTIKRDGQVIIFRAPK